jgi:phage gpG-like protein
MANNFESVIHKGLNEYARRRAALPKRIANTTLNHTVDNFRKQGFNDRVVQPWKPRKGGKDPGRAILVKSGRMRRDFSQNVSFTRIETVNNAPYSKRHNNGDGKMPQRKFMGESEVLNEKNKKLINDTIKGALQ